jgi:hypothetical protein
MRVVRSHRQEFFHMLMIQQWVKPESPFSWFIGTNSAAFYNRMIYVSWVVDIPLNSHLIKFGSLSSVFYYLITGNDWCWFCIEGGSSTLDHLLIWCFWIWTGLWILRWMSTQVRFSERMAILYRHLWLFEVCIHQLGCRISMALVCLSNVRSECCNLFFTPSRILFFVLLCDIFLFLVAFGQSFSTDW